MSNEKLSQIKEITRDSALKKSLKKLIPELNVARDLCESLRERGDRLESAKFYKELKSNIDRAFEYVYFTSKAYLQKGD